MSLPSSALFPRQRVKIFPFFILFYCVLLTAAWTQEISPAADPAGAGGKNPAAEIPDLESEAEGSAASEAPASQTEPGAVDGSAGSSSDDSAGFSEASADASGDPAGSNEAPEEARSVSIIPMMVSEAPRYTALVLTKLVQQNFDRTEALETTLLMDLELPEDEALAAYDNPALLLDTLTAIGAEKGSRYVAAGTISLLGAQYQIRMTIVDAEQNRTALSGTKTAVGLEDVDAVVRAFTDELIAAEFPAVVQEQVREMRKTEAKENARLRDDLAALEQLAEDDPDEAIKQLPETIQRAVAEKAKEEVVQEEIEELYEKEKEETREARIRMWQKYGMLGAYGFRFISDMTLDASIQSGVRSLRAWSLYMNDYDSEWTYEEYRNFHESSNIMVTTSYINGTLGSGALTYAYWYMFDDVMEIRKGTRTILAISNALYLSGRAASYLSGAAGYYSMDRYNQYIGEHPDLPEEETQEKIGDAYDDYRSMHQLYEISRYTALSMQLLGAAGMAVSYFWPGEREVLVQSNRAGFQLGLSNVLSGAGAICGQVALNLYAQGLESKIKADSPTGNPEADVSRMFNTYSISFGVGALALYTGSAFFAYKGIVSEPDRKIAGRERKLPFYMVLAPADGGMTLAFEVRR